MVSTRRQTGKLPSTKQPKYVENSESEVEESFDDQSFARKKKPAPKRQRTSAPKKTLKRRHDATLSMLPDLTLDILFEIFSTLSPKDLVALSRTNKMIRQTLKQPNATIVWKTSRMSIDMPEPYHKFSECGWASFIFGGTFCNSCGTNNVKRINWDLMRRFCSNCLKKNLFYERHFVNLFPKKKKWILDYVIHTDVGPHSHGHSTKSRFFWHDDVVLKIKEFEELAALYGDDSDEYKARLKQSQEHVSEQLKFAEKCYDFQHDYDRTALMLHKKLCGERKQMIIDRFEALGFNPIDVSSFQDFQWGAEDSNTSPLTDAEFAKLRPHFEDEIHRNRRNRVYEDAVFQSRRTLFCALYTSWKAQRASVDWKLFPPADALMRLEVFDSIVFAEPSVHISSSSFDATMAELPQIAATSLRARSEALQEVSRSLKELELSVPSDQLTQLRTLTDLECLNLAVYVADAARPNPGNNICISGEECILGYDGAVHHFDGVPASYNRFPGTPNDLKPEQIFPRFSISKSAPLAAHLVSSIGMNIASTTDRDMDESDARFTCTLCKLDKPVLEVHTWRGMMRHFARTHFRYGLPSQDHPLVVRLSPEEEATVKAQEGTDPQLGYSIWGCQHCATHLDNWKPRQVVFDHLTSSHAITSPCYNVDFMLAPGHQLSNASRYSLENRVGDA